MITSCNCSLPTHFQFKGSLNICTLSTARQLNLDPSWFAPHYSCLCIGCRTILAIDSCNLSGPYKGALLSIITYDLDDGMFALALGVVNSEN